MQERKYHQIMSDAHLHLEEEVEIDGVHEHGDKDEYLVIVKPVSPAPDAIVDCRYQYEGLNRKRDFQGGGNDVVSFESAGAPQFPEEIHIRQAATFLSAPLAPVEPLERRIRQRDRHSSEHGKPGLDRRENRASPLVLPEPCHRPVEEVAGIDDHETRYYEQDNIPCRRPHAVCRLLRCSCICGPWPGGATRSVPRAPHEQYQQICRIQKCANVLRQLG